MDDAALALPAIHDSANSSSQQAQRTFFRLTLALLAFAAVIALGGAIPLTVTDGFDLPVLPPSDGLNFFGALALLALLATFLVRRALGLREPQRAWYDGRAVAESIKSLAWRYAVGGAPFFCAPHQQAGSPDETDELLVNRISEVVEQFETDGRRATVDASQITPWMRRVRGKPLSERRGEYARLRVADQETWYTDKAAWNQERARQWSRASVVLEVVGFAAAAAKAGGWLANVDLLGIVATILAAVVAWTNAKQHTTLAESYAVAAQDLADVQSRIERETSEEGWAEFVANAEAAMSREHTVWRARRSVPTTA